MLAAALEGARVLTLSGVAVYLLHWLARATGDYTCRRWLTLAVLVLVFCGSALADGDDVVVALVGGGVEGAARRGGRLRAAALRLSRRAGVPGCGHDPRGDRNGGAEGHGGSVVGSGGGERRRHRVGMGGHDVSRGKADW